MLRKHKIRPGDTLGGIALATLGSTRHWRAIEAANPGINSKKLPLGKEIVIPDVGSSGGSPVAPAKSSAPQTYTIVPGDSPAKISKHFFGTEKYDKLIMSANGIVDPKKLKVGRVLTIPVPKGR